MRIASFLLFLSVASATAADDTSIKALALHPQHGWIVCQVNKNPQVRKKDPAKTLVSYKYYLSKNNLSSGHFESEPQKIVSNSKKYTIHTQGQDHELKTGSIVLGKDKKPYFIEAVFEDGRAAIIPLKVNCNSRHKLSKESCFAPTQKVNPTIINLSDFISAVHQNCFLKTYCVGTSLSQINNIPLCAHQKIKSENSKNEGVFCGKQDKVRIDAAFSDGTLLLGTTLLNVFPDQTWKYQNHNSSDPITQ